MREVIWDRNKRRNEEVDFKHKIVTKNVVLQTQDMPFCHTT